MALGIFTDAACTTPYVYPASITGLGSVGRVVTL